MAAKCGKCDPHEICEECPEWIFTLADLIMCMMGLFVILWVLKPSATPTPELPDDFVKTAAAIREAFGYLPDPEKDDPIDQYLIRKKAEELMRRGPLGEGRTPLENRGVDGTDPETRTLRDGNHATPGAPVYFEAGRAELTVATRRELDQLAAKIGGYRNIVMIKGHTGSDDLPETATPQQKMDLSLRRAQAVADYLMNHGVSADVLRVQGCSTFEPVIARAYNPQDRARNRRVEIDIKSMLVEDLKDKPRATGPALPLPNIEPQTTTTAVDPGQ